MPQEVCPIGTINLADKEQEFLIEILEAVRAREELMGTGTGNGVAIPHARLETLTKPVLTFGRSISGLAWDSPDGLPVHLVFLLLTPVQDNGLQLQSLAALARGMSREEAHKQLAQADTASGGWFTQAFDTKDWQAAKTLWEELMWLAPREDEVLHSSNLPIINRSVTGNA